MLEVKPPQAHRDYEGAVLFLAGSIEMGSAEPWQAEIVKSLHHLEQLTILNPRRDDWDSSWQQTIDNPQFREQVGWELAGLERATTIGFYFSPGTKSPITLLELGLFARSGKCLVCCPNGFWRKGNVEIVCDRYDVEMVSTFSLFESRLMQLVAKCP